MVCVFSRMENSNPQKENKPLQPPLSRAGRIASKRSASTLQAQKARSQVRTSSKFRGGASRVVRGQERKARTELRKVQTNTHASATRSRIPPRRPGAKSSSRPKSSIKRLGRPATPTVEDQLKQLYIRARKRGVLDLSGKELEEVPQQVWKINSESFGEKWWLLVPITRLILRHNNIVSLPEDVNYSYELTELEVLNCSYNRLLSLPSDLLCLDQLSKLDLSYNQLEQLPSMKGLVNLTHLQLQHNSLKCLPEFNASNIAYLDVSHNQLATITPVDGTYKGLTKLVASDNKLTSLPDLSECLALSHVEVDSNSIGEFPQTLFSLSSLVKLSFRNNQCTEFLTKTEQELVSWPKLKELYLSHNRLSNFNWDELVQRCPALCTLGIHSTSCKRTNS